MPVYRTYSPNGRRAMDGKASGLENAVNRVDDSGGHAMSERSTARIVADTTDRILFGAIKGMRRGCPSSARGRSLCRTHNTGLCSSRHRQRRA